MSIILERLDDLILACTEGSLEKVQRLTEVRTCNKMLMLFEVFETFIFPIFTARKRSLRKLCFYTCLSFCPLGDAWSRGGLLPGGSAPGEGGVYSQGDLLPRGGCLLLGGWLVETPLPRDGHCCGRYASYWNAFLLSYVIPSLNRTMMLIKYKGCRARVTRHHY